jgi:hypothetical protein
MASRLRAPDAGLYDLARVHMEAAAAHLGTEDLPLPTPGPQELARFDDPVAEAFAAPNDLERAFLLATLAAGRDESTRRQAELIIRKATALREQAAIAQVLGRSATLFRQGKFAEALAAIGSTAPDEPRVIRQRALLLLKLERFDEADAEAARLRDSTSPVAREFSASYPSLGLRQRIATSTRMLRAGTVEEALEVLKGAIAGSPEETVELAYCRGFGLTMQFHRLRRAGRIAQARAALDEAMACVEPAVANARSLGHAQLIELYETLDAELSRA